MITIYEALKTKLGREPTNNELKEDVKRILQDCAFDFAQAGRSRHQNRHVPLRQRVSHEKTCAKHTIGICTCESAA